MLRSGFLLTVVKRPVRRTATPHQKTAHTLPAQLPHSQPNTRPPPIRFRSLHCPPNLKQRTDLDSTTPTTDAYMVATTHIFHSVCMVAATHIFHSDCHLFRVYHGSDCISSKQSSHDNHHTNRIRGYYELTQHPPRVSQLSILPHQSVRMRNPMNVRAMKGACEGRSRDVLGTFSGCARDFLVMCERAFL